MKDLRIVVVSWNVGKLLDRCLRSLPGACMSEDGASLDWECVVVDNASSDDSVAVAKRAANDIPNVRVIENPTNDGFAKGCNLGAAGADARYILFLNPDTECPPGSLAKLIRLADKHPKAGIIGPKILNPDLTHQPSVRRFPTVWSQLGILFKQHHVFRALPLFRRYFGDDIPADERRCVDQVMGACFLVRRELMDDKLGFDERYFIWFEEVDFCKTATNKGWEVVYEPGTAIVHHGGRSFAQVFTLKKQRYFDDSLKKYFAKWHPGWRSWTIAAAHYPALGLAWLAGVFKTVCGPWVALVLALETVSVLTIFTTTANTVAISVAGLVMLLVSYKRPQLGLAVLAMELLIGSKGYLLQIGGWPSSMSLRIVLTAAFLAAWGAKTLAERRLPSILRAASFRTPYLALATLVGWGLARGVWNGNAFLLADANAWFFLIMLLPVWDIAMRKGEELRRTVAPVLVVGVMWLAIKTLFVELLFSHQVPHIYGIYLWLRRTGVGEVTRIAGSVFRVFFQSHVHLVPAWLLAASWLWRNHADAKHRNLVAWTMALSTAGLALGMSRSFAVGFVVGVLALTSTYLIGLRERITPKPVPILSKALFGGLALAVLSVFLPLPGVGTASPADILAARGMDAAAASRFKLLPAMWGKIREAPMLGHGFGATVSYDTLDPRLVEQGLATGYTTYAFEWGWLDHWIKFGILGIPVMLWALWSLGRGVWRSSEPDWLRAGAVASLCALATLHVFTPYLNHPLGFFFFLLGEGMLYSHHEFRDRISKQVSLPGSP